MNAALADYALVWRTAVAPSVLRRIVWAMLALIGAGVVAYGPDTRTSTLLVGIPALALILLYWMELAPGAVRQLTPANAALVPRLRRRAMQLVATYWLVSVLALASAAGHAFGRPLLWALGAGIWLATSAMSRVGLRSGMELIFLPLMLSFLPDGLMHTLYGFAASGAGGAACVVLLCAIAVYATRSLFPRGDHLCTQRASLDAGFAKGVTNIAAKGEAELALPGSWYAASLRRATSGRGRAGALLLHATGPGAHWSKSLAYMFLLLGCGVPFAMWLRFTAGADTLDAVSAVSGFVMLPLVLLFVAGPQDTARRLAATSGEQALARLSPLVPDAKRFNGVLAAALVRHAFADWLILTVTFLILTAAFGASVRMILLQAAICCMALPCMAIVLRDYARGTDVGLAVFGGIALVIGGAVGGAILAARASPEFAAATLLALAVPLSVLAIGWRARRMLRAPHAFPAGRMAG